MRHEVMDADSAVALGSGDVPVLATPRLIAWMEAQTVREAQALLGAGQTTVGIAIRIQHLRATPVGGVVNVTATPPIEAASRRLTFSVLAVDGSGRIVGQGEIERAIVDRDRFLAGLSAAHTAADAGTDTDASH
ncbi:MAG TPA: thioesterase [Actinocrinis sp.]|nr:thioesterase [Actinocrinis sp.]